MRRLTVLVVLATVAQNVAAQDTLAIAAGERVRLTLQSSHRPVIGVLLGQDRDSLRVQADSNSAPVAVARTDVTSVEASLGRHGHAGSGALAGLVFGGIVGAAAGSSCQDDFLCPGAGGGALLLGGTGLVFGALVGVLVRSERWERVYPEEVGVAVMTTRYGVGVGVSVAF